ncbi:MAG: cob(I)yrinic acid a,c-diamide adenosyltransferase [Tannerella sp.]|jgi:cob(I)alamin adenosyltransferase|nr:cob(I)yrinic acid a,c-diamide adenosyltransferase [Tannerella sp.]
MKKSFLYTGGGDNGMTSLVGGARVPKTHPRIEAYGTLDELNSFIGWLAAETGDDDTREILQHIQHRLFRIGAYLATETEGAESGISTEAVGQLEEAIDRIDGALPRMKGFVLPGGCPEAALAHVCRTVCRRAERLIYTLSETATVDHAILVYINRLSDLLFALARHECRIRNREEIIWKKTGV